VFEAFKCGLIRHKVDEVSRGESHLPRLREFSAKMREMDGKLEKSESWCLEW